MQGTAHLPRRMFAARPAVKQSVPAPDHLRMRSVAPEKEPPIEAKRQDASSSSSSSSSTYPRNISTSKETWDSILQMVKGTVLEAMARSIPRSDRTFFAQRWGFVQVEEAAEGAGVREWGSEERDREDC